MAEAKVAAEYAKHHWNVFTQTSGKAPFDLVVYKDGELRRIQVKGTSYEVRPGVYSVQLRSTRHNMNGAVAKKFQADSCDELVIYVEPVDRIFFVDPKSITNANSICVTPASTTWQAFEQPN